MKFTIPQLENITPALERSIDSSVKGYLANIDHGAFQEAAKEISDKLEVGFDKQLQLLALYCQDGYPDIIVSLDYEVLFSDNCAVGIKIGNHHFGMNSFVVRGDKLSDGGEFIIFKDPVSLFAIRTMFDLIFATQMDDDKNKWAENMNNFLKNIQGVEQDILAGSIPMHEDAQ